MIDLSGMTLAQKMYALKYAQEPKKIPYRLAWVEDRPGYTSGKLRTSRNHRAMILRKAEKAYGDSAYWRAVDEAYANGGNNRAAYNAGERIESRYTHLRSFKIAYQKRNLYLKAHDRINH